MPTALQWSGGKDSAHALVRLRAGGTHDVRCLVSVVDGQGRSTVHGLPLRVLRAQADAAGLPLETVVVADAGLRDYPSAMSVAARGLHERGVRAVAFGDLGSSGARVHHERIFAPTGLEVVEPLWDMTSHEAVQRCVDAGIVARIVVVDAAVLGPELLGRALDEEVIAGLPPGCDPSGERGEYHTVVVDAPGFAHPLDLHDDGMECVEHVIGTSRGSEVFRYHRLRCGVGAREHDGPPSAG